MYQRSVPSGSESAPGDQAPVASMPFHWPITTPRHDQVRPPSSDAARPTVLRSVRLATASGQAFGSAVVNICMREGAGEDASEGAATSEGSFT